MDLHETSWVSKTIPWTLHVRLHGSPWMSIILHVVGGTCILHGASMEISQRCTWRVHGIFLGAYEFPFIPMKIPWILMYRRGSQQISIDLPGGTQSLHGDSMGTPLGLHRRVRPESIGSSWASMNLQGRISMDVHRSSWDSIDLHESPTQRTPFIFMELD